MELNHDAVILAFGFPQEFLVSFFRSLSYLDSNISFNVGKFGYGYF